MSIALGLPRPDYIEGRVVKQEQPARAVLMGCWPKRIYIDRIGAAAD